MLTKARKQTNKTNLNFAADVDDPRSTLAIHLLTRLHETKQEMQIMQIIKAPIGEI